MKKLPAYVTVNRLDLMGYKAVPTGKLDGERAEFVIIEANPHRIDKVWLTRNEIS